MVRNWQGALLLVVALAAAGCISPTNSTLGDQGTPEEPTPVLMSDTITHRSGISGPSVAPQESVVGGPWDFTAPGDLQRLEVSLTWTREQNDLRLRIETPSGETLTRSASGQNVSFTPQDAAPGAYTFEALASGVVVQDEATLRISYSWLQDPAGQTTKDSLIEYVRDGGKWRATITYSTQDDAAEDLVLDVDTFNGPISVTKTTGPAKATLTSWARADTKERAAELVQNLQISLGIEGDRLTAHATDPSTRSGSESTGASVDVRAPASVSGHVDTSNGRISLEDLSTTGLTADTSNGQIMGKLTSSGDLTFDTSNGGIDLHIVPTDSIALNVDTSNGAIDLTLDESSDIGYRLDAETSNGAITEDMDEAELTGEEDTEKRLETSGFTGRTIQVTGTVDTSNGKIRFDGA